MHPIGGRLEADPRVCQRLTITAVSTVCAKSRRCGASAQDTRDSGALRRAFTVAIKSLNGGPLSNQMEDANTKGAVKSAVGSPRSAAGHGRRGCTQLET